MNDSKQEVSFVVKAVQTYKSRKKGELSFKKNQLIQVTNTNETEFLYFGQYQGKQGIQSGWFPYFYVKSTGTVLQKGETISTPRSKLSGSMEVKMDEIDLSAAASGSPVISSPIPSINSAEKKRSISRRSRNKSIFQSSEHSTEDKVKKLDEQYVLKSGMLSKRSQANTSLWKPIWVVLRVSHITYYKSAVDKRPLGKLSVDTIKSVSIENGLGDHVNYCFAINTHSKKHALILSTVTLEECEEWMAMIEFAIKGGKPVTAAEQLLKKDAKEEKQEINPAEIQKLIFGRPKEIIIRNEISSPEYLNRIATLSRDELSEVSVSNLHLLMSKHQKINAIGKVRANYDYIGKSISEFTFRKNDEIILIERKQIDGWWYGYFEDKYGHFPSSYVSTLEEFEIDLHSLIENTYRSQSSSSSPSSPNSSNSNNGSNHHSQNVNNNASDSEEQKNSSLNSSSMSESQSSPTVERKRTEKSTTLINNYQVGELLGVGGFGSVYRGIDVETGVMVAIKQVDLDRVNKSELKTIMGELNLLKVLDHINIVQYKGFIKTSDHLNIILDFVEGGSLYSLLNKFGPMHGDLVIRYIKQILEGLDYLHSQNVVHNDIKCGNILITKSGVVKLADFGIASLGENSDENLISGSPYWMAPEVIQLKGSSPASDIWSLGCTIIELLIGRPPFFEFNKMQALFAIVENDMIIPKGISPKMEDFLKKCFNKQPDLRPTAKQLLQHPLLHGNAADAFRDDDGSESEEEDEIPISNQIRDEDANKSSFDSSDNSENSDSDDEDDDDEEEEEEEEEEESEEDIQFRREEKDTKEILSWFSAALDKGNITHIIKLRKAVRQKLSTLRALKLNERYRPLFILVRSSLRKCDSMYGDNMPIDPMEAKEDEEDSDFDEEDTQ